MLQQMELAVDTPPRATAAHVLVIGNEKGGAGKSTLAMHVIVALLKAGKRVAALDLDLRQRSLSRYLNNRRLHQPCAPMPYEISAPGAAAALHDEAFVQQQETALAELMQRTGERCDVLVVDAPGSDSSLSRAVHAYADTLLTPLNDSFVDFDLLAEFDPHSNEPMGPGVYAELVWESRKRKAARQRRPIDWVVLRNRMASGVVEARNSQRMSQALRELAPRIGFRVAPGLAERVIYRELFPNGATLLDLSEGELKRQLKMSHVAARQELRDLLIVLKLPVFNGADLGF